MNKLGETEKSLEKILDLLTGGQKILGLDEHFYVNLPTNIKDNIWARFRLSIVLSQGMPAARFTATTTVLPESKQARGAETQNALVRVTSILDDELIDYIDQKHITTERNPKLFHRLNAVHNECTLPNITELHRIREIRNGISHDLNPPELSWQEINEAADEVEKVLIFLRILTFITNFEIGEIEHTALTESEVDGEKYRRTLILRINQNGNIFCEYSWQYIFY